jgi:small subunit ribosomal protein S20
MAITKSAQKALRQSETRKSLNRMYEKKIKDIFKEVSVLVAEKKTVEANKLMPQIYKILDKAAKANVIKKNTASRRKARVTRMVSKIA